MKKVNLKRTMLAIAFPVVLLGISSTCFAFGERGCVNNPDTNKGQCKKNVEGTYTCIEASSGRDCVSSN